jgi:hypothetical protein
MIPRQELISKGWSKWVHCVAASKKYPVLKIANGDLLASSVHKKDKLFKNNISDLKMLADEDVFNSV